MLTSRGLDRVLADLSTLGYDAEWGVVGADDAGAPHRRERIWILVYSVRNGCHADNGRQPLHDSNGIGPAHATGRTELESRPLAQVNTPSGNWPTPTCADAFTDKLKSDQQKEGSMHSVNLSQAVKMWPTRVSSMFERIFPCGAYQEERSGQVERTGWITRSWPQMVVN